MSNQSLGEHMVVFSEEQCLEWSGEHEVTEAWEKNLVIMNEELSVRWSSGYNNGDLVNVIYLGFGLLPGLVPDNLKYNKMKVSGNWCLLSCLIHSYFPSGEPTASAPQAEDGAATSSRYPDPSEPIYTDPALFER